MIHVLDIVLVLGAYLLGSIPTAVWVGKHFYGIDVREHGSGNAGATNTIRVIGMKAGIPVLLFDVFKGWLAVNLVFISTYSIPETVSFINFQLVLGTAALLGHIFPVFAGFRGGKGVATLLGLVLAIDTYPTLICVGIFILVLILSKYVSLSSIIAGFSFPIMVIYIFKTTITSLVIFSLFVAIMLLLTHQKNLQRLLNNKESKATFLMKKKH